MAWAGARLSRHAERLSKLRDSNANLAADAFPRSGGYGSGGGAAKGSNNNGHPQQQQQQHRPPTRDELAARDHVVQSAEFYTSTGCRDLLLHPCECSFTLLELGALLEAANLDLVGLWFQGLDADRRARQLYDASASSGGGYAAGDGPDRQTDLRRWHALEEAHTDLFGRMHVLYAQKRC